MVIIPAKFYYHLTITLASRLYLLMCSMLDSIQHVRVFLKHPHSLQADTENPNGRPHVCNKWYKYHPRVLNPLTLAGVKLPLNCTAHT